MPVETDSLSPNRMNELLKDKAIKALDLPQISQNNLLHRKADI